MVVQPLTSFRKLVGAFSDGVALREHQLSVGWSLEAFDLTVSISCSSNGSSMDSNDSSDSSMGSNTRDSSSSNMARNSGSSNNKVRSSDSNNHGSSRNSSTSWILFLCAFPDQCWFAEIVVQQPRQRGHRTFGQKLPFPFWTFHCIGSYISW